MINYIFNASTEFKVLIVKAPFNIFKFLTDDVNLHNFGLT